MKKTHLIRCLLCWLVVAGLLAACVKEVKLPIRQVQPVLVVDGLITDEPPPYLVKLSFTNPFQSGQAVNVRLDPVNGALVTVSDDEGLTVRQEQDPFTPTYYFLRDSTFRGRVGRQYTLTVRLDDGTEYVSSPEVMAPVAPIERVYAQYLQRPSGATVPDAYQVYVDTRDPATPGNYYRWSGYGYVPRPSTGGPFGCCSRC